jgi:phosphopantothenoylcysteine decarboxylase/phosphopantothenate--cysteine ligase
MGVELVRELAYRGAEVTLVHGPLEVPVPQLSNIQSISVTTARDMLGQCLEYALKSDIAILCAAVADYRPAHYSETKIKKPHSSLRGALAPWQSTNPGLLRDARSDEFDGLSLELNPDILATLGQQPNKPFLVGFAAETDNLEKNAIDKCRRKNCDLICANHASAIGKDFNQISIYESNGLVKTLKPGSKASVARLILDEVLINASKDLNK